MKAFLSTFLIAAFHVVWCQDAQNGQETVLDSITHLEDRIYYVVPELPRLCDSVDSVKERVDIGGCSLFVEMEGDGIPVVLINGGPGGTHHYFHPWFSGIRENHRVIYYDQRGTGLSDFNPQKGYTFRQAVEDLEKLRKKLKIPQWVVCGFSYGGGLAQMYSATYPEHVLGMVLISPLPLFESEHFVSEQEKYFSEPEKKKKNDLVREYLKGSLSLEAFIYNLRLNGDWKRQNYYKPSEDEMIRTALYEWVNDADFNSVMSEDCGRYDLRGVFENCPLPTLIYEGRNDLTWGGKKAASFKDSHPLAKLIVFEDAAHMVFRDVPAEFFSSLTKFTRSIQPPERAQVLAWKEQIAKKLLPVSSIRNDQ